MTFHSDTERNDIQSHPIETQKTFPGPWPWYVMVGTGLMLSGLFPWMIFSWALYRRGSKKRAFLTFFVNLVVFAFFGWSVASAECVWWWLTVFTYLFNLAWASAAWLLQRKTMGAAAPRYKLNAWKSWLTPILVGIIVGVCIATVFSVGPAFENRMGMRSALESLDRGTVLWDFFKYSFLGFPLGFLLGLWWAGDRKGFSSSRVIIFLSAFLLTICLWGLLGYLLFFLARKGSFMGYETFDLSRWAVIPPWITGYRKYILHLQGFEILTLLIVPLLLGTVSRIRDFGKRALLIPMTFICVLPMSFNSDEWWNGIQDQIVYEMSSPDLQTKARAHKWAEIMLSRYPNHLQWPAIAENLARYYYGQGEYERSKSLYQTVADRCRNSNQWYWTLSRAQAALNNPDFGEPSTHTGLNIPVVDYEEYLTHNWMALLAVVRYWKGSKVPESEIKIQLKDFSRSDDKILLNPLVSFADLDDAARNLGYEVLIIPAKLERAKALMEAGFPLIHQSYASFQVLFGFDETRSALSSYSFKKLSLRLMNETHKEAREILSMEEEGRGESKKRLARIANEAYRESSVGFWGNPFLSYMGPLLAVVFPAEKAGALASTLNTPFSALKKQSNGYLAALIGLSYLNHGDPVSAVEWARIGAKNTTEPFPLYVAHLANLFWQSRRNLIRSNIGLQVQFPQLARVFTFFDASENRAFLKRARIRFEATLEAGILPWTIQHSYISKLVRSDPEDLHQIIELTRKTLGANPAYYKDWQLLSSAYEWADDMPGLVEALRGLTSCDPMDFKAKLRLALGYVLLGRHADAKAMLDKIDPRQVKYDADYPFCIGAISEWEGDVTKALKNYETAVEMRRYKPIYHLRYGSLLLKEGLSIQARKALEWAAMIDAGGSLEEQALSLLSRQKGNQNK